MKTKILLLLLLFATMRMMMMNKFFFSNIKSWVDSAVSMSVFGREICRQVFQVIYQLRSCKFLKEYLNGFLKWKKRKKSTNIFSEDSHSSICIINMERYAWTFDIKYFTWKYRIYLVLWKARAFIFASKVIYEQ